MSAAILLLAALVLPIRAGAEGLRGATQSYSADSLTNSASGRAGSLAPNTLATVYGADLAYFTKAVTPDDITAGLLPIKLAGVNVYVGGLLANLLYVSPRQVNFLVPYTLRSGAVDFRIDREGTRGPTVRVTLTETAPALFQLDPETALAVHADGSLVTRDAPAQPDEIIVFYATGLGRTIPEQVDGQLATRAATLATGPFRVLLSAEALPEANVLYAGLAPGYAGLYQINVKLPGALVPETEIRISIGDQSSPPGLRLTVK